MSAKAGIRKLVNAVSIHHAIPAADDSGAPGDGLTGIATRQLVEGSQKLGAQCASTCARRGNERREPPQGGLGITFKFLLVLLDASKRIAPEQASDLPLRYSRSLV
jgi:hypothetical protein